MAKQSVLLAVMVYGLLMTSVLGSNRDNGGCSWMAIGAGILTGAGAIVASPIVLAGAGFTGAGVAAGSIAAALQGSAVASGSVFAIAQSAGAAGLAVTTQAGIAAAAGAAGYKAVRAARGCEKPNCDD